MPGIYDADLILTAPPSPSSVRNLDVLDILLASPDPLPTVCLVLEAGLSADPSCLLVTVRQSYSGRRLAD